MSEQPQVPEQDVRLQISSRRVKFHDGSHAQVRSQRSLRMINEIQGDTERSFSPNSSVFPYLCHSKDARYSFLWQIISSLKNFSTISVVTLRIPNFSCHGQYIRIFSLVSLDALRSSVMAAFSLSIPSLFMQT